MGLDIYVGPLSRYYSGNWKTIVEQVGDADGIEVIVVRPDGFPAAEVAHEQVLLWREALSSIEEFPPFDWMESPTGEYWTDKPGWDALSGLALLALACEFPETPAPGRVLDVNSRANPYRAIFKQVYWNRGPGLFARLRGQRTAADPSVRPRFAHLLLPELWLPVETGDPFDVDGPVGARLMVGSVTGLEMQLADLNDRTIRASPEALDRASKDGPRGASDPVEQHAIFGMSVLMEAVRQSRRLGQPIKLDY